MTIKLKRGKSVENVLKNLRNLNNQSVSIGHFGNDTHSSDPTLTYVDLLKAYFAGNLRGVDLGAVRNPRAVFAFQNIETLNKDPKFNAILKKWVDSAVKLTNDEILDDIGVYLRDEYKKVFGKVSYPYMPPDSTGTPMKETGELRDNTSYKTSKNPTPKK